MYIHMYIYLSICRHRYMHVRVCMYTCVSTHTYPHTTALCNSLIYVRTQLQLLKYISHTYNLVLAPTTPASLSPISHSNKQARETSTQACIQILHKTNAPISATLTTLTTLLLPPTSNSQNPQQTSPYNTLLPQNLNPQFLYPQFPQNPWTKESAIRVLAVIAAKSGSILSTVPHSANVGSEGAGGEGDYKMYGYKYM